MKYCSSTYLRDVSKFLIYFIIKDTYAVVIKKIIDILEPTVLNEDGVLVKVLDNGYYVIEYMEFDKNYICRLHLDGNKNIIERFYRMTKENKVFDGIPAYKDMYLSYVITNKTKKVYNYDAYSSKINNEISIDEDKLIREKFSLLIKMVKNNEENAMKIDFKKLIEECEELECK